MSEHTGRDVNGEIRSSQRTNFKYAEPAIFTSAGGREKEVENENTSSSFWEYLISSPLLLLSIAAVVGLAVGYLLFSPQVVAELLEETTE